MQKVNHFSWETQNAKVSMWQESNGIIRIEMREYCPLLGQYELTSAGCYDTVARAMQYVNDGKT